jgi:hypothetical protein
MWYHTTLSSEYTRVSGWPSEGHEKLCQIKFTKLRIPHAVDSETNTLYVTGLKEFNSYTAKLFIYSTTMIFSTENMKDLKTNICKTLKLYI